METFEISGCISMDCRNPIFKLPFKPDQSISVSLEMSAALSSFE
jgi:hypothetical protein